jgi:hypothetical protein
MVPESYCVERVKRSRTISWVSSSHFYHHPHASLMSFAPQHCYLAHPLAQTGGRSQAFRHLFQRPWILGECYRQAQVQLLRRIPTPCGPIWDYTKFTNFRRQLRPSANRSPLPASTTAHHKLAHQFHLFHYLACWRNNLAVSVLGMEGLDGTAGSRITRPPCDNQGPVLSQITLLPNILGTSAGNNDHGFLVTTPQQNKGG